MVYERRAAMEARKAKLQQQACTESATSIITSLTGASDQLGRWA